jgi:NADH-quinone oxidoreductase subunit L
MEQNLVLLLLLTPFVGFLFNVFFGKKVGKGMSGTIGTLSIAVSFVISIYFFMQLYFNSLLLYFLMRTRKAHFS